MILDSEEQRDTLKQVIATWKMTGTMDELMQVIVELRNVYIAVENAEIKIKESESA
jgi:hypothetical protein